MNESVVYLLLRNRQRHHLNALPSSIGVIKRHMTKFNHKEEVSYFRGHNTNLRALFCARRGNALSSFCFGSKITGFGHRRDIVCVLHIAIPIRVMHTRILR